MTEARKHELLVQLVDYLYQERKEHTDEGAGIFAPLQDAPFDELWTTFRALVNTRPIWDAPDEFLTMQDELLQGMIADAGITQVADLTPAPRDPRLRLWQGDITTLAADAIVNAANSQLLGCWVPGHHCIDNAIHTFAGVQLRAECNRIMQAQRHDEPTAQVKITPAYNLPARHVIHTVGPIAAGSPTATQRAQLAQCYTACLDVATQARCTSIAFCCISTGVFGFPQEAAARIAVETVCGWLNKHTSPMTVIFNVFLDTDECIYRELLS